MGIRGLAVPTMLLFAGHAMAQTVDIDAVRRSTVWISASFVDPSNPENRCDAVNFGSGVIISEDGYVLTVAHTFDAPAVCAENGLTDVRATARVGYVSSAEQTLTMVAENRETDVSMGRLGERAEPYPKLNVCTDHFAPSNLLWAYGFPEAQDFTPLQVMYSNSSGPLGRWSISGLVTYGYSGGPVLNADGAVVGLVQGGRRGAAAVNYVVPVPHAASIISYAGLDALQKCEVLGGRPEGAPSDGLAELAARVQGLELALAAVKEPRSLAMAVAGSQVFDLREGGRIWRLAGLACQGEGCPERELVDENPNTRAITGNNDWLYQLHAGGLIFRMAAATRCWNNGGNICAWEAIDNNPHTVSITAGSNQLYQLQDDGRIWRSTGLACQAGGCYGWEQVFPAP